MLDEMVKNPDRQLLDFINERMAKQAVLDPAKQHEMLIAAHLPGHFGADPGGAVQDDLEGRTLLARHAEAVSRAGRAMPQLYIIQRGQGRLPPSDLAKCQIAMGPHRNRLCGTLPHLGSGQHTHFGDGGYSVAFL